MSGWARLSGDMLVWGVFVCWCVPGSLWGINQNWVRVIAGGSVQFDQYSCDPLAGVFPAAAR